MKKQTARLIPLLAAGIVPATTVTSGLWSPTALGAPGDLDPSFGDVGRLGPILDSPAWSLNLQDDGSVLLAGGTYYPGYYYWGYYPAYARNFVSHLSDTGLIDPDFTAASIGNTQVFDVIRQPDGLVIAVGRRAGSSIGTSLLIVFRLQSDGSLDTTFGDAGTFVLSPVDYGDRHVGTSTVLDPDGQIVVAGSRDDSLIVVRLLPDGSLDGSFGTAGVFTGPDTYIFSNKYSAGPRTNILRTAAGGYRVTASNPAGCQVVALTSGGVLDTAFGTAGIATVDTAVGPATFCNSMATQADGRLLVAGKADGQGFAARMLADGQPDPGFSANAVSGALSEATAVAVGEDDSIVVAGEGVSGESIMRLQATGELDVLFGNAGSTLIDLASETGTSPVVHDLYVASDGSVMAAGGEQFSNQAFVIRLLGTGGGNSPGVLGVVEQTDIPTAEGTDEVVVNVRRTGGASGSVSLSYQTASVGFSSATEGKDYVVVAGSLTWEDGDTTDQQVRVPILVDNSVEGFEYFAVSLSNAQGGAGIGTSNANVAIAPDGGPFGQLGFANSSYRTQESVPAEVAVERSYYSSGAVSVTLTPIAGTATAGDDFVADPVTLSWADGESGVKFASIAIVDDPAEETSETFTIQLSNPTNGASIGPRSSAIVNILASDVPPSNQVSSGGGAFGYLSVLLLGVIAFLRSARMVIRSRRSSCSRPH